MKRSIVLSALMMSACVEPASAQYADWQHSGSLFILTTPEGANLPAAALERDFPLLVRLHKDFFDDAKVQVAAGSVSGNVLRLRLATPSAAQRITYLDSKTWSPTNLLCGPNGIAALTFCRVPISPK